MHKKRVQISKDEKFYNKVYKKPIGPSNSFSLFMKAYIRKHALENKIKLKGDNVTLF